jgi:hypothetical protein
MEAKASKSISKIVKRGFAWARASGSQLAVGATAPVLGSSQNDLVFSSMLFVSRQTDVLCRGVSIDNESDQAT